MESSRVITSIDIGAQKIVQPLRPNETVNSPLIINSNNFAHPLIPLPIHKEKIGFIECYVYGGYDNSVVWDA